MNRKQILAFLLVSVISFSQSQFQLAIGGSNFDYAFSITLLENNSFAVAGCTESNGAVSRNMYIVKLTSGGALLWTRIIGGTSVDEAESIIKTPDGGFVVAGYTMSFGAGDEDIYIVKLDSSGMLQWNKTVGGANEDGAYEIVQTTDGGYAVVGWTRSFGAGDYDIYIVKLNGSGSVQWNKTIGGPDQDYASSIIQTNDRGYVVAGATGFLNPLIYIVKLDSSGTLQWNRTVGGGTGWGYSASVIQTIDGGYAVAGYTTSYSAGSYDMNILKFDTSGNLQWGKTIGGASSEVASSIIQTTDGGYIASGSTESFGVGGRDIYIVKLDGSGSLLWSKTVGRPNCDACASFALTAEGDYILVGNTDNSCTSGYSDIYIVKLDSNMNTCGNSTLPASSSRTGGILGNTNPTITSPTPTITIPSPIVDSGGSLITICVIGIQPISNEIPASYKLYQNYPNPFNPVTTIRFDIPPSNLKAGVAGGMAVSLKIYDITGKEVLGMTEEKPAGSYSVTFDGTNFASGLYIYKFETGNYSDTKKMVLIK